MFCFFRGVSIACTSLARRSLWFGGIMKFECDYIYADTDSIKVKNYNTPEHRKAIREYNRYITNKLKEACDFHHIPYSSLRPKTIKGEAKPLGVWDFEGAGQFKTLRAKSYMTCKDGKYKITNSGFLGDKVVKYLHTKYGNNLFDVYNDDLYIPKGYTGKNTHTYIDFPIEGDIIDYKGNKGHYKEMSCVHLESTDYHLKMSPEYLLYLMTLEGISSEY